MQRDSQEETERRWSDGSLPRYGGVGQTASVSTTLKVGLLLPLTGQYANYGKNMLNAATLALFDANLSRPIDLLPRDTAGNAASASAAAVGALADGASALIGPVAPAAVVAAARAVAESGAPLLMLSSDRRLAEPGSFAAGHAPEAMATRIVDFAFRKGVRRIAALAPRSAYGEAAMRGLQAAAAARGIQLGPAGYLTDRATSNDIQGILRQALAAIGPDGALFLPFPAEKLRPLALAIAVLTVEKPPILLGLDRWASVGLTTLPSFGRAFYASADPAVTASFRQRYAAAFGTAPARGAALVYDLVAMVGVAAQSARGKGLGVHTIQAATGFQGVEGPFRFTREGGIERGYAIIGIQQGQLTVVESAPAQFGPNG